MIRVLLAKDLRRARRNPTPWLVHLAMPLLITALIGMAFGRGSGGGGGMGRVKLALVDEDDSMLTRFLRGALTQREAGKHLEVNLTDRAEALGLLTNNQISAAVILPAGFTDDYLAGRQGVSLELVKNPAQSIYPAMVEELLGGVVTVLNALARPLQQAAPPWQTALDRPGGPDWTAMANLIQGSGEQLEAARPYLFPPLVGYTRESRTETPKEPTPGMGVFAFLLPGLTAVFLLFMADNAIRDLYREGRFGTLERYRTLRQHLIEFIAAKVLFALVILLIAMAILLGGGALLFGFSWRAPGLLALLGLSYGLFAAGFMAVIAGLAGKERRADILNTVLAMMMGLAGGCMFPADQLPGFLRTYVTPYMPTRWFVAAAHDLQSGGEGRVWLMATLGLLALGLVALWLAARLFTRRLERGIRA
ncbi:MAG: ABC transporter permease [Verrucomicrobia bacterium]|nr:ABC transporter permease [Verrucomicrobiota bacterium]